MAKAKDDFTDLSDLFVEITGETTVVEVQQTRYPIRFDQIREERRLADYLSTITLGKEFEDAIDEPEISR